MSFAGEHNSEIISEKEKSSFGRDLAIKTAKAAATTAAIAGATAIAGTASKRIGTSIGDKIADFVTGSGRKSNKRRGSRRNRKDDDSRRRHRNKKTKRTGRRGRGKMSRRNESSSVEGQLRQQNKELKEALRQTGVALVLSNHLPKVEESKHRSFVSSLRSYNDFESMVEFDEYVSGEIQGFLNEDEDKADEEANEEPVEESAEGSEESTVEEGKDADAGALEESAPAQPSNDPLGLLGGVNGYMYERIVFPKA